MATFSPSLTCCLGLRSTLAIHCDNRRDDLALLLVSFRESFLERFLQLPVAPPPPAAVVD